jgi:hypothetical protein
MSQYSSSYLIKRYIIIAVETTLLNNLKIKKNIKRKLACVYKYVYIKRCEIW